MLNKIIKNKPKVHSREITLTTYSHTDSRVIVHGILKDQRYVKVFDVSGAVLEPGIVHHIDVKLLIKFNPLTIEGAEAQLLHYPLDECNETLDTIDELKGIEIKTGFSKQVHSIMGGKKGCAHLCQLIIVMSQEIVQGSLTHKRQNKSPVPKDIDSFSDKDYLINSCRMWTEQGPKMKNLKKAINAQKPV